MIPSVVKSALALAGVSALVATSGVPQDQLGWGKATQALQQSAQNNAQMAQAIAQWKALGQTSILPFDSYASFLLAHPGWPQENALRRSAENALSRGAAPANITAFFDKFPPLTGEGGAFYAEALASVGRRADAEQAARTAWRKGALPATAESKLLTYFSGALRPEDHDARMDALLWQNVTLTAARELPLTSPGARPIFAARLAFRNNAPEASQLAAAAETLGARDAGYIADRAIWLRKTGNGAAAQSWLARSRSLATRPGNVEEWYEVLLSNAKAAADAGSYQVAYDIARQVDDAYPAGTDVSKRPYGERDDYTSLAWLAGQTALKQLGRPMDAAVMFDRYGRGSQTPSTRSKGLYWAGRAAQAGGNAAQARAWFEQAAGLRDQYYGQLANERLGRPLVAPGAPPPLQVDPLYRSSFQSKDVVRAAQYLGYINNWQDQTAFVRQIAADATTDADHVLADELARQLGRPDLGVMVGRSALQNGLTEYSALGFPTVKVPATQASQWTLIHAIARQESQFDRGAVSRTGARGLMQLMPGTAREQAGKLGLAYDASALNVNTDYNIQLGSSYFQRIYNNYGSWPLAIAAYNAGGGNVNKWLRANGDPRTGAVDVVEWVEAIPFLETRNYVQRVLENMVVYDLLNPAQAQSRGPNRLSWYLGKNQPG
ncbi:lytic transglycosylase domain-containing protein [Sphingomonas aracearum]|uniref:Lytic transglycosylase domain-containing protein n=1 Tax=Sphingomonas aracearum TaxID=2283317 RepID=A0A369VY22_9SPHN|nr:lytic transglycosylase domain-containing protein [Sphingomonas aracearum]RDE06517.1 lytic transglycosylase domain-containing protein [Sphingomonas aracearum]